MPRAHVVIEANIPVSTRVMQLGGMFDCPVEEKQRLEWDFDVPFDDDWNVGLLVGPSGSGKTTIASSLFKVANEPEWSVNDAVVDGFPQTMSVEDIAALCNGVGFGTIPAWMRPYHVLSNGEKFRVNMARLLAEYPDDVVVVDEFTSLVDRQVARVASHSVQRTVRKHGRKFVGVTCHYDVVDWLQPDWVIDMANGGTFARRSVQPRPSLDCRIVRVPYSEWARFAPFHYLTASLSRGAKCYELQVEGRPAAFGAMLHRVTPARQSNHIMGLSRLVTLPDWQGMGLAFVLTDRLAAMHKALGWTFATYPAHPALIRSFDRSDKWRLKKKPGQFGDMYLRDETGRGIMRRPCAMFEWAGAAHDDVVEAEAVLGIPPTIRDDLAKRSLMTTRGLKKAIQAHRGLDKKARKK